MLKIAFVLGKKSATERWGCVVLNRQRLPWLYNLGSCCFGLVLNSSLRALFWQITCVMSLILRLINCLSQAESTKGNPPQQGSSSTGVSYCHFQTGQLKSSLPNSLSLCLRTYKLDFLILNMLLPTIIWKKIGQDLSSLARNTIWVFTENICQTLI